MATRSKEQRREVIDSGSPLADHSLNQHKLQISEQGHTRVANRRADLGLPAFLPKDKASPENALTDLPLSPAFIEEMLPFMIGLAGNRIEDEEKRVLTVPQRIARVITDVDKIYGEAKKKNLDGKITSEAPEFPTRQNTKRYKYPLSKSFFLALLNKTNWDKNGIPKIAVYSAFGKFFESYSSNLSSYNFALPKADQVAERVIVYSYLLASLESFSTSISSVVAPQFTSVVNDYVFHRFTEISRECVQSRVRH